MKKNTKQYFAFLILAITAFVSLNQNVKAAITCPPGGFTNTTIYIPYGNCTYAVDVCYRCGITGGDPTNVIFLAQAPPPGCPPIPQSVINNAILANYSYYCTVPPCSSPLRTRFALETATCRKWVNQTTIDANNVIHHITFSVICGDARCVTEFDVCLDYSTNPPTWAGSLVAKYRIGTRCIIKESEISIPPIGKTFDEDWETECAEYNECE